MIVVSNTSPLLNLAVVGQLDLLRQLYGRLVVPQAVHDEIVGAGLDKPGTVTFTDADWIEIRKISSQSHKQSLLITLDEGEAEAIVLAGELNAGLLLIDERIGRRTASRIAAGIERPGSAAAFSSYHGSV